MPESAIVEYKRDGHSPVCFQSDHKRRSQWAHGALDLGPPELMEFLEFLLPYAIAPDPPSSAFRLSLPRAIPCPRILKTSWGLGICSGSIASIIRAFQLRPLLMPSHHILSGNLEILKSRHKETSMTKGHAMTAQRSKWVSLFI